MSCNIQAHDFKTIVNNAMQAFNEQSYDQAELYFQQADAIYPNQPELLSNLATCYKKNQKTEEAIELLYRVIKIKPDYSKAYLQLITLLKEASRHNEVEELLTKLILHEPENASVHVECARYYKEREQFDLCVEHYEKAVQLEPNRYAYRFELAIIYTLLGQTEKAIKSYDLMLQSNPNNITMIYNKGYAYKMQGDADIAIELYKKAIELDTNYNAAHFALGMAYLIKGDFKNGWEKHARYLKQVNRNGDKLRTYFAEGTTQGKRILLRPEGGLGDTINFVRYARELKKYGIHVIVATQKPLYDLLKHCDYIDELIKIGDPMTPFDDHTTLMSIPAILYSHEERLPDFSPYITPDPERVAYWGQYLQHDTNFKIGICWESSVANDVSRPPVARRGMPLELMYILSELDNVSLYSLQQHDGVEQLQSIPPYFKVHTFDKDFDKTHGSFVDTTAVMHHMDLIISVDTAIAHLAGALAKPVWLLLPWATDWRWLEHKTTSPWYPTMKIFKQPKPFDWQTPINEIFWRLTNKIQ
jgi:tetratricopeptide (TPR) repeat protein